MKDFLRARSFYYPAFLLAGWTVAQFSPPCAGFFIALPIFYAWHRKKKYHLLALKLYFAAFGLAIVSGFASVAVFGYQPQIAALMFCVSFAFVAAEAMARLPHNKMRTLI